MNPSQLTYKPLKIQAIERSSPAKDLPSITATHPYLHLDIMQRQPLLIQILEESSQRRILPVLITSLLPLRRNITHDQHSLIDHLQ